MKLLGFPSLLPISPPFVEYEILPATEQPSWRPLHGFHGLASGGSLGEHTNDNPQK